MDGSSIARFAHILRTMVGRCMGAYIDAEREGWGVKRSFVITVVLLATVGFGVQRYRDVQQNTPGAHYLKAMHEAAPAGATVTDAQYLKEGYDVCSVYDAKGWDGVDASLYGIYKTRGSDARDAWRVLALKATTYLCPLDLGGVPSTDDPPYPNN